MGPIAELTVVGLFLFPFQLLAIVLNWIGLGAILTVANIILTYKIIGNKMEVKPDFKKVDDKTKIKLNNGKIVGEKPGITAKPGISSMGTKAPIK